jgi:replicative DNA helicase
VAEQRLLELLFADEKLRHEILPRLTSDDYEGLPTAVIFQALLELEQEGAALDFGTLSPKTQDDVIASELVPLLLMSDAVLAEQDRADRLIAADRCIDALRLMKVDRRIDDLKSELAAAERNGEKERLDQLATEQIELTRLRSALRPQAEAAPAGQ